MNSTSTPEPGKLQKLLPGERPPPILFPDLASQERGRRRRETVRLESVARQTDALRAATAHGHRAGYEEGYVDGGIMGLWTGALTGVITTGVAGCIAFALRTWIIAP